MRVLVTGGAGFIGANFVHWTLAHRPGTAVTVLDALTYAGNRPASTAPTSSWSSGDIADAALVDRLVADATSSSTSPPSRTTTTRCTTRRRS
jgi:dTDP-glucose 4,6-dehydratase